MSDGNGPPLNLPGDQARGEAAHELAKGQYAQRDSSLLSKVADWIRKLFGHAPNVHHPRLLEILAFIALAIVVALVVVVIARSGGLGRNRRAPGAVFEADDVRTAADHRRDAEAAATAGRWEDAIVSRFRAAVAELTEQGVLTERLSRTAAEAADEAGQRIPSASGTLRAGARTFDDVAYGGRRGDPDRYAVVVGADDAARSAGGSVRSGRRATADAGAPDGIR